MGAVEGRMDVVDVDESLDADGEFEDRGRRGDEGECGDDRLPSASPEEVRPTDHSLVSGRALGLVLRRVSSLRDGRGSLKPATTGR